MQNYAKRLIEYPYTNIHQLVLKPNGELLVMNGEDTRWTTSAVGPVTNLTFDNEGSLSVMTVYGRPLWYSLPYRGTIT